MHWIQFWMCLKCIAVAWIFPSMRGRELLLCMHTSYRSAEHEANFNCLETSTCKECCYLRRSQYPYIFIFVTVFVGKWAKFGIFLCFYFSVWFLLVQMQWILLFITWFLGTLLHISKKFLFFLTFSWDFDSFYISFFSHALSLSFSFTLVCDTFKFSILFFKLKYDFQGMNLTFIADYYVCIAETPNGWANRQ